MIAQRKLFFARDEITRPSNTTAYTAGDAINETVTRNLSMLNAAEFNGQALELVSISVRGDQSAEVWTPRISLIQAAGSLADNVALTLGYSSFGGESPTFIASSLALATAALAKPHAVSTFVHAVWRAGSQRHIYQCGPASKDIFYILGTDDAFTPVSGAKYTVECAFLRI